MARKKLIADNADYVAAQISFLKDGTELIDPSAGAGRVVFCHICNKPIPRFCGTSYYIAFGKSYRICELCYKKYRQTFDIDVCRKSSKKGGK